MRSLESLESFEKLCQWKIAKKNACALALLLAGAGARFKAINVPLVLCCLQQIESTYSGINKAPPQKHQL